MVLSRGGRTLVDRPAEIIVHVAPTGTRLLSDGL
jgi:hypothetical protein